MEIFLYFHEKFCQNSFDSSHKKQQFLPQKSHSENFVWEYVWIEFDGLRAKETIELAGLSVDQPVYKARYKDLADLMKSEMLYIVNHKEESPFHLIGHLYLFIDSLVCPLLTAYGMDSPFALLPYKMPVPEMQ